MAGYIVRVTRHWAFQRLSQPRRLAQGNARHTASQQVNKRCCLVLISRAGAQVAPRRRRRLLIVRSASARTASLSLSTLSLARAPALSAQMRAHKRCKLLYALERRFGKKKKKKMLEKHSMFQFCAAFFFFADRPRESESVKLPVTSCLFEFASWLSIAVSTWLAGWKTSDQK